MPLRERTLPALNSNQRPTSASQRADLRDEIALGELRAVGGIAPRAVTHCGVEPRQRGGEACRHR